MKKRFGLPTFQKWENAFLNNMDIPFVTKSALIEISELEEFLADVKKLKTKPDSIRICFLRFQLNETGPHGKISGKNAKVPEGCKWVLTGKGSDLTQAAVALVPATNFRIGEKDKIVGADDIIEGGSILVLMPGVEHVGPTGHNPPPGADPVEVDH